VVVISKSREVNADTERVWGVISDVDNEPKYYDGLGSVKNISRDGNIIEREVVVGFLKHEGRQTVMLKPKTSVEVIMTKGPMTGKRVTTIIPLGYHKTKIEIEWDVELRVPTFVQGMVKGEIEKGTERALDRIATGAETTQQRVKRHE
jgi:carbon monoxide dehydrogenase subunit G